MLKNYIKITFRSMLWNSVSTVVNVVGLSISMIVGVIIFAFIKSHLETDHFHPFVEKTFRVTTQVQDGNNKSRWATSPQPLSGMLSTLSFIDKTTTVRFGGSMTVSAQKMEMPVEVLFAEPSFFDIFGFKSSRGDAGKLLTGANSVLISQEIAGKLFGGIDPTGKFLQLDAWGTYQVAGVIEKPVFRTHLSVEVMLSLDAAIALEKKGLISAGSQNWKNYKNSATYALTNSTNDHSKLNAELLKIAEEVNKSSNGKYIFSAQGLEEITPWNPEIKNDFHAGENWAGIITWAFLALALTILAAFNYTALSVAKILTRAKEVGIRKTNGAQRKQIFLQFVTESVMLSLIALVIAYLTLLMFYHSGTMSLDREINVFPDFQFLSLLLAYTLITGLVAGAIPAIILSGFKPIDVLKNLKNIRIVRKFNLYRIIIVIQFSVTTMLMIFFVILRDIGSDVRNSLITRLPDNVTVIDLKNMPATLLVSDIEQISQVKKVSLSGFLPISNPVDKCTLSIAKSDAKTILSTAFIDQNFVDVFNLKFAAGNNITGRKTAGIEQYALINESAGRLLRNGKGNINDLIGEVVLLDSVNIEITGILRDDSFAAQSVVPSIFHFNNANARFISIQGVAGSEKRIHDFCRAAWTAHFPGLIPEIYSFKERNLTEYQREMSNINLSFGSLCSIVMFVSCLGIFGMANYSVHSNTMQIGIRKTFGATKRQVITSVTKPFVIILLISGIVGIPLGYLCGSLLKTRFGTHVDLGISNLLIGFAIVMIVALGVVISQTFRSAKINPAQVLRGE